MKTREELLKRGHNLDANSMIYGKQLVQAILSAPTEEQVNCKYCYGMTLQDFHRLVENRGGDISLRPYLNNVKYCPYCGRKLGDE